MLNQLVREGLQNFIILTKVFTKGEKLCIFHWKIGVFLFRPSILSVAKLSFTGKGGNSIKIINIFSPTPQKHILEDKDR